jgi:predicted membrane chloride channel (bestrophin family)
MCDLLGAVNGLRASCVDVVMHIQTQIPYPYVHVVTLLVNVHCLLLCFTAGTVIGENIWTSTKGGVALGVIILFFATTAFQVVLEIVRIIENPFSDDSINFPLDQYLENSYLSSQWLLDHPVNPPDDRAEDDQGRLVAVSPRPSSSTPLLRAKVDVSGVELQSPKHVCEA